MTMGETSTSGRSAGGISNTRAARAVHRTAAFRQRERIFVATRLPRHWLISSMPSGHPTCGISPSRRRASTRRAWVSTRATAGSRFGRSCGPARRCRTADRTHAPRQPGRPVAPPNWTAPCGRQALHGARQAWIAAHCPVELGPRIPNRPHFARSSQEQQRRRPRGVRRGPPAYRGPSGQIVRGARAPRP